MSSSNISWSAQQHYKCLVCLLKASLRLPALHDQRMDYSTALFLPFFNFCLSSHPSYPFVQHEQHFSPPHMSCYIHTGSTSFV